MPARTADPLRLALFWLGIQAVWGALLGISLQSRTIELAGSGALVWYGRLAAGGALVAAATQVGVGLWADRRRARGSRRLEFYALGALAAVPAILAFFSTRSLLGLAGAFCAVQLALNVATGPYQAIIPDFVERGRVGRASSWMAALQGGGNAAGALAASFIASARLLGAALSALLLATCALTSVHARGLRLREAPPEAPALHHSRSFVDLFISRSFMYVGFYTLLGYLLFYVTAVLRAATPAAARRETGILIVAFTLVGALGAALAARPSDRLDKRLVATAGGAAFIAALGCFIASHTLAAIVAATLLAGIGWGVFLVADWALACRLLPPGAMAAAMGLWNLAIVVPQIVAPAFTTLVLVRLGESSSPQGPRLAFALALGESLVGVAWLWRLSRCVTGE